MNRQLYMGGGILSVVPRDRALLGGLKRAVKKTVKKVTGGIKDIISSDIGKAALLAAGTYYAGGGNLFGLQRAGMDKFALSNLPGISSLTSSGFMKDAAKTAAIAGFGGWLGSEYGMQEEEIAGLDNNKDEKAKYLRLYYSNLNQDAKPEEIEEFVRTNLSIGGRVGFATGPVLPPDTTQPVNPFGPKPGDFGVEENIEISEGNMGDADEHSWRMFNKPFKDLTPPELQEFWDEMERLQNKFSKMDREGILMASAPDPADERNQVLESMSEKYYKKPLHKLTPDQFMDLEEALDEMSDAPIDREHKRITLYGGGDPAVAAAGIEGLPLNKNPAGITELDLRETGGFIPPVGVKEKADDIPAMLSNNEFVLTADAVRGMGDGDVKEGARRLYSMMKNLENGGRV